MRFKKGVNPNGVRPELLSALVVIDGVYRSEYGLELIVTSLNDGRHSRTSLHYAGAAADLRIRMPVSRRSSNYWEIPPDELPAFVQKIDRALGSNPDFDVVLESDHIHLEYQPKYRGA